MPAFEYANNFTRAAVSFPAHKFPHTSSVYYQCNVSLCINANGGCNQMHECNRLAAPAGPSPNPNPSQSEPAGASAGVRRRRRFANPDKPASQPVRRAGSATGRLESRPKLVAADEAAVSFDVYSGLLVSDGTEQQDLPAASPAATDLGSEPSNLNQLINNAGVSFDAPAGPSAEPAPSDAAGPRRQRAALIGAVCAVSLLVALLLVGCQSGFALFDRHSQSVVANQSGQQQRQQHLSAATCVRIVTSQTGRQFAAPSRC